MSAFRHGLITKLMGRALNMLGYCNVVDLSDSCDSSMRSSEHCWKNNYLYPTVVGSRLLETHLGFFYSNKYHNSHFIPETLLQYPDRRPSLLRKTPFASSLFILITSLIVFSSQKNLYFRTYYINVSTAPGSLY